MADSNIGRLSRRSLLSLTTPALAASLGLLPSCTSRRPETPLAHLYGPEWVHGAYRHYAEVYQGLEQEAQKQSHQTYRYLATRGIGSLSNLQAREVPFHIRVSDDRRAFQVQRNVPERLTFHANMSKAEREEAKQVWERARSSIHLDYQEVQQLDGALSLLLSQVNQVRLAMDEGELEQYRICRQLLELSQGGELSFELPYQVSRADYMQVLELLVLRIERDRGRLQHLESSMVVVGLTARATDAGSGSLAPNLSRALVAVLEDAEALEDAEVAFPEGELLEAEKQAGKALVRRIQDSAGFKVWLAAEERAEDAFGQLLMVLDAATGLPTSKVYYQLLSLWRGEADYLSYLSMALGWLPGGSHIISAVQFAVERTSEYREAYQRAASALGSAERVARDVTRGDLDLGAVLLNTSSQYARDRLGEQLVYLSSSEELQELEQTLGPLVAR